MNKLIFRISLRVGLITAVVIILYWTSNLLLVYKYFKFDYYLLVAIIFALTGFIITRYSKANSEKQLLNNPLAGLTNKELQVLVLIAEGKTNKEIAALNFIELSTVKTHINNIYAKLDVNSRKQAAEICVRQLSVNKSTFSPPAAI